MSSIFSRPSPVTPCELHCRPVNEYFSEKMLDAVTDGTTCFMNNKSRNICVNGVCKVVWLGKRLKEAGGLVAEQGPDAEQRRGRRRCSVQTLHLTLFRCNVSVVAFFMCLCVCDVCRTSAVTVASTRTQWRTAVGFAWATAQAARRSISRSTRQAASVSSGYLSSN